MSSCWSRCPRQRLSTGATLTTSPTQRRRMLPPYSGQRSLPSLRSSPSPGPPPAFFEPDSAEALVSLGVEADLCWLQRNSVGHSRIGSTSRAVFFSAHFLVLGLLSLQVLVVPSLRTVCVWSFGTWPCTTVTALGRGNDHDRAVSEYGCLTLWVVRNVRIDIWLGCPGPLN